VDSGCYIAVFHLATARAITVGRLGRFAFAAGEYLYVGSAQRGLAARLARHARKRKPRRWHIDYLSTAADMLGAIIVPAGKDAECRLANELAETFERCMPGFGASDCRCAGHLFYMPQWP